jgi:hypothetical protein
LEVRRPVELLEELRALQRDLDELGDSVAAVLLEQAERCFLAWKMDEGERYLEWALSRVRKNLGEPAPVVGTAIGQHFASCALAVA